jgi:hypothetical protein
MVDDPFKKEICEKVDELLQMPDCAVEMRRSTHYIFVAAVPNDPDLREKLVELEALLKQIG